MDGYLEVTDIFKGATLRVPLAEFEHAARATGFAQIRHAVRC